MGEREVSVSLLVFFVMNNSNIDVCNEILINYQYAVLCLELYSCQEFMLC